MCLLEHLLGHDGFHPYILITKLLEFLNLSKSILIIVEIDIDHSILMPQISQTNFRLTRDLEEPKALESTVRK